MASCDSVIKKMITEGLECFANYSLLKDSYKEEYSNHTITRMLQRDPELYLSRYEFRIITIINTMVLLLIADTTSTIPSRITSSFCYNGIALLGTMLNIESFSRRITVTQENALEALELYDELESAIYQFYKDSSSLNASAILKVRFGELVIWYSKFVTNQKRKMDQHNNL